MSTTTTTTAAIPATTSPIPTSTDPINASRQYLRAFGQHYDYDVSYVEELLEASPGAFQAFEGAMATGQYRKAAPLELLALVKLTATRVEDCGPCTLLGVKMAREAGVAETVIQGALHRGRGLPPEQLEVHQYAHAVAANEPLDPEFLSRLKSRLGAEVMAELAVAIVGARIYPTLKRAMGHASSCSLIPELVA
ncbi:MAG: hypothetical protein ACAI34_18660 [Verrucomicrobium sp.]